MRRRSASRWPGLLALAGLGLAAGLALMAALSLPHLATVSPADGALAVSTRARLSLVFDQPMEAASVAAGLSLDPALPGDLAWDAAGTTLTFTPRQSWPPGGQVRLSLAGGRSRLGLPLLERRTWSFTVGLERVAFLTGAPANLAAVSIAEDAQPGFLTVEPYGVADYAIRPDGGQIVYAARRADGGADLRAIPIDGGDPAEVLACPGAACLAPAFSPDGTRLAYERQTPAPAADGGAGFGDPRIYVLTLATGQAALAGDPASQARSPAWTPDGRLSYYDAGRQAVAVLGAAGGVTYIPSSSGEPGTFSPDGRYYVFPEIVLLENAITLTGTLAVTENVPVSVAGFYSHLLRAEIATNAAQDLSGPGVVEDASPVYSVAGDWLAFGRKPLVDQAWQPGRQLWLMRADGSEARQLTETPEYNHSAFAWHPDGRRLVLMRFNAIDPNAAPEIWLINSDGTGARRLAAGGYSPEWLP
ncbi:MAG: PD40 domain-containing protein [Anaerolineales bacterium]|nr:PD40 domain-containing protein [Anaerolineales bacterium]